MGLGVSHGCFRGPYSSFTDWRVELAAAAGLPPLMLMEGYFREDEWGGVKASAAVYRNGDGFGRTEYRLSRVFEQLPIKWARYRDDVLVVLLTHSDDDGEIEVKDCLPLAERLEELLPIVRGEFWQRVTRTFADGLRKAAELGEKVEFS
jgi:hypothetical protein